MQHLCSSVNCRSAQLGHVVGLQRQPSRARTVRSGVPRTTFVQQGQQRTTAAGSAASQAAAGRGKQARAASNGSELAAASSLLQRMLATCSLADRSTLLLAVTLTGGLLLGAAVAEPALAAHIASDPHAAASSAPQLLGDLAENEDFWANVLRYISYYFSVLLGTAYIAVKPLQELMKRPQTAVLVVAGVGSLVFFVSFTMQAMLGMNDTIDFTASSIVTPM